MRSLALLPPAVAALLQRIPVRLSVRVDRRRHEHREEVRAGRAALPFVERRAWRSSTARATSRCARSALGYLAHLAADSVAHNYFVPTAAGRHVEHVVARPLVLGKPVRDAPRHRVRAARARADPHRPLALRRAARPRAEPDDLQHADQPPDLPRHGDRGRQRIVAADLPAA